MSVYIRELARELGKLGHKVDVFTRVHDPHDALMESLGRNARLIHLRAGSDEAMHKLVLYSYLPDFAGSLEDFRRASDLRYDLIFSHYWLSGKVGQEVRRWWGVPHLQMFHTLGVIKNSLGVGEAEPALRLEEEAELARNCDRIIAATAREKAVLVGDCGAAADRVAVVPCGVNLRTFRPIDRTAARTQAGLGAGKTVLFAGRIEPLKGIDLLVRAFAALPEGQAKRLVLIGGDAGNAAEIGQLKLLAHELGIGDAVVFPGTVRHELMPYFYNAADVCVVPSHYESFGLVALEALACGTPVVATDVGDLRHIIRQGETGYVLPDHSVSSLTAKLAEVLAWPDRDPRQARLIRDSVAGFSWGSIASQIGEVFQGAVNHHLSGVSSQ
jgi:D-inositol-3-phosphate glycosyltransferase